MCLDLFLDSSDHFIKIDLKGDKKKEIKQVTIKMVIIAVPEKDAKVFD